MSEPDKVCVLITPPKRTFTTAIEFKVCYWSCENEPLHLDVFETHIGVPNGPPIAQSVCHFSDIVDEYAVFKFSEGYRMNEEPYGLAFYTNAEFLSLYQPNGDPMVIANKNGAVFQSSDFLITEPQEDVVFTLSTTKE